MEIERDPFLCGGLRPGGIVGGISERGFHVPPNQIRMAGNGAAVDAAPIAIASGMLMVAVERMEGLASRLKDRLGPVLAPSIGKPTQNEALKATPGSQIRNWLDNTADRLNVAGDALQSILDQLEV